MTTSVQYFFNSRFNTTLDRAMLLSPCSGAMGVASKALLSGNLSGKYRWVACPPEHLPAIKRVSSPLLWVVQMQNLDLPTNYLISTVFIICKLCEKDIQVSGSPPQIHLDKTIHLQLHNHHNSKQSK